MKTWMKLLTILLCLSLLLPLLPQAARATEDEEDEEEFTVISLGDSFAAGEGNPPYYGQDRSMKLKCKDPSFMGHQSEDNWAGQLRVSGLDGKLADYRGTCWQFAASSGATTENIMRTGTKVVDPATNRKEGQQTKVYDREGCKGVFQMPGQLDVFYENESVDRNKVKYVTLSIGGNDVNFEGIITKAATSSNSTELYDAIDSKLDHFFDKGSTYYKLRETYERIAEAAPNATIIVTGYPELLDPNGSSMFFSQEEAEYINNAVRIFNTYIDGIIQQCKGKGMKIEFVDVAEEFRGHGANSSDPYLHGIMIGAREQELNSWAAVSSGSIHPNKKGMQAYAKCVQYKIDELEGKLPERVVSDKQNIVLVLDTSGSMDGAPIRETRSAAKNFIDRVVVEDASVGLVTYSYDAAMRSDFTKDAAALKDIVNRIGADGMTNTEDGVRTAAAMLKRTDAGKKIIVLMSDGLANVGLTGADLTAYMESLKAEGIYVYTLGFFEDLSGSDLSEGQGAMEEAASPGCHYEVEDADQLVAFFDDIADQINGQAYAYVRIACPVDVEVSCDGESLNSRTGDTRASFGTMTFEAGEDDGSSRDNRTKILRLREDGREYQITIRGNGNGTMHYTAGFMDENGEYTDLREIKDVPITPRTVIEANAERDEATILRVDTDGDGDVDETYREGGPPFRWWIVALAGGGVLVILVAVLLLLRRKKRSRGKQPAPAVPTMPVGNRPAAPVQSYGAPAARPAPPPPPQASAGSRFCGNCGAGVNGGSAFCPNCGAKL